MIDHRRSSPHQGRSKAGLPLYSFKLAVSFHRAQGVYVGCTRIKRNGSSQRIAKLHLGHARLPRSICMSCNATVAARGNRYRRPPCRSALSVNRRKNEPIIEREINTYERSTSLLEPAANRQGAEIETVEPDLLDKVAHYFFSVLIVS